MSGDGESTRREVLGDEHVDRAQEKTTPFTADFQDLITRYAWGEIWSRPGLDRRTRSAITLTALVAGGHEAELELHLRAALRNGLTRGRDQGSADADGDLLRRPGGQLGIRGGPARAGRIAPRPNTFDISREAVSDLYAERSRGHG